MPLRMLFVDDKPETVRYAIESVKSEFECIQVGFEDYKQSLADFLPHIVVIDRMEGDSPYLKAEGDSVFDFIWSERFCPIVIYSAYPEVSEDERQKHPLVKFVTKGSEIKEFLSNVGLLRPFVEGLKEAEVFYLKQFAKTLRDVAPYLMKVYSDPSQLKDAILRSSRRRFAAFMDDQVRLGGALASWEHYLYPPVSPDIKLGDILFLAGSEKEIPENYRVVLTPSCDMVTSGGRVSVDLILTGRCCSTQSGLELCAISIPEKGKREKFEGLVSKTMLTQGYRNPVIPFPALEGRIPAFMVNLRKLEMIPMGEIGTDEKKYVRIASIDSPFRELVAWAYMSVACRPGLPERDINAWVKEISDEVFSGK